MQTLDIISVNLWQILISLLNLVILYLLFKHFLFKPVKKMLANRQAELDKQYAQAEQAELLANENKKAWEDKLSTADAEANAILQNAAENARSRGDKILEDAQKRADSMVHAAQVEVELERRKAAESIKREIVEVSGMLAEKMLEREIKQDDHRNMIDAFLEKIGDGND